MESEDLDPLRMALTPRDSRRWSELLHSRCSMVCPISRSSAMDDRRIFFLPCPSSILRERIYSFPASCLDTNFCFCEGKCSHLHGVYCSCLYLIPSPESLANPHMDLICFFVCLMEKYRSVNSVVILPCVQTAIHLLDNDADGSRMTCPPDQPWFSRQFCVEDYWGEIGMCMEMG